MALADTLHIRLSIFLLLLCSSIPLYGQGTEDKLPGQITHNLSTQLSVFPQEKLHLHTDRSVYMAGEKIWLKAYLTHALDLNMISPSRYVYVELLSPADTLVNRIKIRAVNNLHHGVLEIPTGLSPGNYTLCAYTKNMINLGEDYFFKKQIRVGSAEMNKEQQEVMDYKVAVFPEGGYLLEGALCRVAFKAVNEKGTGEQILEAELTDQEGRVVKQDIRSSHLGMGVFSFIPEKGKSYTLNCRNSDDIWQHIQLPQARQDLCGVTVNWRNDDKLLVGLQKATDWADSPLYVMIHRGGEPQYTGRIHPSKPYLLLSKESLPQGILHVLLLNESGNILSERLVFCRKEQTVPEISFSTDKDIYTAREKVTATLSLQDANGQPLRGHLSVAVTDNLAVLPDRSITLPSTLLLTSELKGNIENPGYYFNSPSSQTDEALDVLLMTQGWRRYDIPEVVRGNITHPSVLPELTPSISGKVMGLVSSKGLKGSEVSLFSPQDTLYALLEVDENGFYNYRRYEYPENRTFYLQAYTRRGGDRLRLHVDRDTFPKVKPILGLPDFTPQSGDSKATSFNITKKNYRYDEYGTRVIDLPEVTARAFAKKEKELSIYTASAEYIATQEDIKRYQQPTAKEVLTYMKGKGIQKVVGNYIFLVGSGPENRKVPALLLLDGIIMDDLDLSLIYTTTIEQIEVIPPYKGGMFGTRGEGGAINIVSKYDADEYARLDMAVLKPLGYQPPTAFYAPLYTTELQRSVPEADYRTTIYWRPDLLPDENGKVTFDFYTSDAIPTNYSVVIEGIATDGGLIRKEEGLNIENK